MTVKGGNPESSTITNLTMAATDFVRVIIGGASRKISLQSFAIAIFPFFPLLPFIDRKITTITGNYAITSADDVVLADTSGGEISINLPTAASVFSATTEKSGQFTVKKITSDGNNVNINPNGSETIDGDTGLVIVGGSLAHFNIVSDGFNWFII